MIMGTIPRPQIPRDASKTNEITDTRLVLDCPELFVRWSLRSISIASDQAEEAKFFAGVGSKLMPGHLRDAYQVERRNCVDMVADQCLSAA